MDNALPISEQLVLYMDGELGAAEKARIEELLVSDASVKAEWESLQQTKAAIRHYGLQQKVGSIHQQMMNEMRAPVRKIRSVNRAVRYTMAIAASIVLLVGGFMVYNFLNLSSGRVFSSNYKAYELSITRNGNTPETAAEKAYREKNYKEVMRIHNAGEDRTVKGEFLCGVASLELNDNTKAIQCFNEVLDMNKASSGTLLNDETEYYLALAYIGNKDYDFALPLLRKIKDDVKHIYHNSVSNRLIRQVKMLKWR